MRKLHDAVYKERRLNRASKYSVKSLPSPTCTALSLTLQHAEHIVYPDPKLVWLDEHTLTIHTDLSGTRESALDPFMRS